MHNEHANTREVGNVNVDLTRGRARRGKNLGMLSPNRCKVYNITNTFIIPPIH